MIDSLNWLRNRYVDTQTNRQIGLPGKLTELKHLLTAQTGNKKTCCQDEADNYGKMFWQYRSPRTCALSTYLLLLAASTFFLSGHINNLASGERRTDRCVHIRNCTYSCTALQTSPDYLVFFRTNKLSPSLCEKRCRRGRA